MNKINLRNIKPHTIVSIVMIVFLIVNHILAIMGKPMIQFDEASVSYAIDIVLSLIAILYPAWKNNSVTENAQYADTVLYMLRDGKITVDEVEEFIDKYKER